MRLRFFLPLVVIAFYFALVSSVGAQTPSPLVVTAQDLEMKFPRAMRFTIEAESTSPIQELRLTVWQRGVAIGSRFAPQFTPSTRVRAAFEWNFQSFSFGGYLPPGTRGEYTWHIEDAAGNVRDTPRREYVVQDRARVWQTVASDQLRVNWDVGSAEFGAAVFQRARAARAFLSGQLGIENIDPLEIFIYGNKTDFFGALPPFSAEWTGGRTFPEYGVIMINFAPENLEWGLRATSHELSHAVLHAKIRGTIGELSMPHWLDEGLAVYNETDDHAPDEQFQEAFQHAVRRNALIPLRQMQLRFPEDSAQAQLAYGESYSIVKFMLEEYGMERFAQLLNIYQKGAPPDDGLLEAYGMNQDQLENVWRTKIGAPLRPVSPVTLPTILPRPTYDFSSSLTRVTATPPALAPTALPTRAALLQTPVPAPASAIPAQAPTAPASGVCGGALALGGLITFAAWRRIRC